MKFSDIRSKITNDIHNFIDYYGLNFLIFVSLIIHVFKGFIFGGGSTGLIGTPLLFIYRDYNLNASRIQILKSISLIPWSLKPLFGLLSDTLLLNGYKKIYY